MGLFDKLNQPVFIKEDSNAAEQVEALKELYGRATDKAKIQIEQDIKYISYGIKGEEQIAFELKNSHMPMYVLHDLYLEYEALSAQIDYLIITRKGIFVIECKNLFGDITINNNGDFVRSMNLGRKVVKEGIYSPITQNKRHLEIIRQIRGQDKGALTRVFFDKYFYDRYHSIVVLANPKTILNTKYAPKEVKEQVIRADQLIEYIKKVNTRINVEPNNDKEMKALAEYFLSKHKAKEMTYHNKYELLLEEDPTDSVESAESVECSDNIDLLIQKMKEYRLKQSREDKVKPYYIFTDKQMLEIIEKKPNSIEALMNVSGFGEVKCGKYGEQILESLKL